MDFVDLLSGSGLLARLGMALCAPTLWCVMAPTAWQEAELEPIVPAILPASLLMLMLTFVGMVCLARLLGNQVPRIAKTRMLVQTEPAVTLLLTALPD